MYVQVRYLQIAKKSKTYNPYRWVRYVTQANSYVARLWGTLQTNRTKFQLWIMNICELQTFAELQIVCLYCWWEVELCFALFWIHLFQLFRLLITWKTWRANGHSFDSLCKFLVFYLSILFKQNRKSISKIKCQNWKLITKIKC